MAIFAYRLFFVPKNRVIPKKEDYKMSDQYYSVEAEQCVLGGIMLSQAAFEHVTLEKDDFYMSEHKEIFNVICQLAKTNQDIDIITVSDKLESQKPYKPYGGLAYLSLLVEHTPSAANIVAYAAIVKDRSLKRQAKILLDSDNIDFSQIAKLAEKANMKRGGNVQIKQFTDLEKLEFAGIKWVVDGLIPEGTRNLLAAKPKAGKSWLALEIANAIATGGKFLDRKCDKGRVLYLALEDNDRRMKSRITALKFGFNKNISYATAGNFPAADQGGIEALAAWCDKCEKDNKDNKPKLIIIDTFAKFRPKNNNASMYQSDYESTQSLLKIAESYGVAILLIHHTRKMQSEDPLETISGSLGLIGGLDNLFVLERQRNSNLGKLSIIGRDLENDDPINLMFEACHWKAITDSESLITPDRARLALMILDGYAIKEMAGILEKQEGAIYKMLHDMTNAGIIYRQGRGDYLICSDISRDYLETVVKNTVIENFHKKSKDNSLPSLPESYPESYPQIVQNF